MNKDRFEKYKIPMLTRLDFTSDIINPEQKESKEILQEYLDIIHELLVDSLSKYSDKISIKNIQDSFINWNPSKIKYPWIKSTECKKFYYMTKPIYINSKLLITIEFYKVPLGGIRACLYNYNDSGNFQLIKSESIVMYGSLFR
ncbi:MAG: hypothetical protein ACK40G_18320 [Cytophagaceae bacterium]